jgi:hypothetical protein
MCSTFNLRIEKESFKDLIKLAKGSKNLLPKKEKNILLCYLTKKKGLAGIKRPRVLIAFSPKAIIFSPLESD